MNSRDRFRKCRICRNTLSAETALGKLKLTPSPDAYTADHKNLFELPAGAAKIFHLRRP
jgi:hypothetical protein